MLKLLRWGRLNDGSKRLSATLFCTVDMRGGSDRSAIAACPSYLRWLFARRHSRGRADRGSPCWRDSRPASKKGRQVKLVKLIRIQPRSISEERFGPQ
jgi:hypothetical protein